MSLLDDVSIVVTPNGYKAGELYAVVPVPTEGAEEVTNGGFDTDSDWSKGTGWTISGGKANSDGTSGSNNLSQSSILLVDKRYKIEITVSNYVSGNVQVSAGASPRGTMSANGTYTFYQTCTPSTSFYIIANSFDGSIDNVSVKEYTSADMDVTRATAATRVDEDGLVNYAEVIGSDLVTNGDFATDLSGWSNKSSTSTWVSGSARIDNSIGNANSGLFQDIGLILGKTYTLTATLKLISADSNGNFVVLTSNSGGGGQTIIYTGNALVIGGASVTETIEFTTADSDVSIQLACNTTNAVFEIDNVSVKEVTRDNVPRIDYTGGGCPHILAEPQRTNLITYSEDFSQSYWTKQSGVTPTYNTTETLSPDGTYNATKFIGNGSSGVLKGGISVTGVIARSVYLKSITGTVNVVLKDPNLTVTQKTLTVTEEWQRFELIESNGTSTQGIWIDDIPASGIYIWGAQLEVGSYSTSYIPTSGSTVTRNQDIFTRDGIGSLINSTEGVLFVEMAALSDDLTYRILSLSDGTDAERIYIQYTSTTNQVSVVVKTGSSTQANIQHTLTDETVFSKMAFKWKANDFAFWIDGVEVGTDTSGSVPSGLNRLALDRQLNTNTFYGKVKQLQVYNTALTDEQLLQLTGTSGTDFYESYAEMASALTYTIQ